MEITKQDRAQIAKKILDGDYKSGIMCRFVTVDSGVGIKTYSYIGSRNAAYLRQQKAHALGLGPAVGKRFTLKYKNFWGEYDKLYCFVTQIARNIGRKRSDENIQRLKDALKKNKLEQAAEDLHFDNVGTVDGKMVCIDFIY